VNEPDPHATISDSERSERLVALRELIELMRPSVQQDGGDLLLVGADVETGVVEVQLQGSCTSCAISASTLEGEVRGGVDESADPIEAALLGRGAYVPKG
jgi:Fe-S cluster biogenesis protein NfuA